MSGRESTKGVVKKAANSSPEIAPLMKAKRVNSKKAGAKQQTRVPVAAVENESELVEKSNSGARM